MKRILIFFFFLTLTPVLSYNMKDTIPVLAKTSETLTLPVLSYPNGTYHKNIKVTITAGKGTRLYYTTNGKTPSKDSKRYTKPIELSKTTILKVIAFKGNRKSAVCSVSYTIKKNRTDHDTSETFYYEWEDNSKSWIYDLEINESSYQYFLDKENIHHDGVNYDYAAYVTDPEDDEFIQGLAESFLSAAENVDYSEEQLLDMIITFVQSLNYITDYESKGQLEYPKYPIETLYEGNGDCEDFCILLSSILNALDIDNVLLQFPGHMAVGIAGKYKGTYFLYEGIRYFYIETTMPGWSIGEFPSEYNSAQILTVS